VVADIVRLSGIFRVVGFLDSLDPGRKGTSFCGAPVLGGEEQLEILRGQNVGHLIVGVGDCRARLSLAGAARRSGFELATAIHPGAILAQDVTVGQGTVIVAGSVINPGAVIGENVIVNTSSSVDHDCRVENGAHIGPGAHLGGGVTIGEGAWVGMGAVIREGIRIGKGSVIGAGAVVLRDIPEAVVAYGLPAQVIRKVEQ
jgi:sugar O-acyltransferase (sialic acid O-acetyltransferase NeuD family)